MAVIEWLQFLIGAVFLILGLGIFTVEMIGVYRFHYVLNRMHAAAMGDTLGIGFCLVGLIIMNGANLTSLKLFLVVCFLWFSSPTSSHLIARLEVTTDPEPEKHYRKVPLDTLEEELSKREEVSGAEKSDELYGTEAECVRMDGAVTDDVKTPANGTRTDIQGAEA
ncbi:MAG: monovalent cation/H(+) antiporter subunit G [Clostridiales bacterium]|nr:monovalent cation/H(+) antiporter subunit G [Clostridiales bacterium]MCC8065628.1 monovalent cation/H(+) antiporter subunit G [Clostridiales bacterium]